VEELEMTLVEIKKTRGKDKEIVKVVKEIKRKAGVKTLREKEWKIERKKADIEEEEDICVKE